MPAQVTWDLPAGNPRVTAYKISVREVNATGWPLKGGGAGDATYTVPAAKGRALVVAKLRSGAFYAFVAQASRPGASPSGWEQGWDGGSDWGWVEPRPPLLGAARRSQ